jgi:hypothetical protein
LTCLYTGNLAECSPAGVQTYITTNDLLGKCNYSKFDQDGYYPSTGPGNGNWSTQTRGISSAYPEDVYNNLDGTNTKPYSCFNSLYAGVGYSQC